MDIFDNARQGNLEAMKRFIVTGANVNDVDEYGNTALIYAAGGGYTECAIALLDAKADVNKSSPHGMTPLLETSYAGHMECFCLFIQHKANVNAQSTGGYSALHYASIKGRLWCVQMLVAAGAEIDSVDMLFMTPLDEARVNNRPEIAEFLLHSGAKVNVPPDTQIPAWMFNMIRKRRNIMSFTLVLKGVLKRRCGIVKDVTNLIALYFWSMRLK